MPMTVVVTRNVEGRYRGFLASAMLEISPGVYVSPDLSKGVRERIWSVLAGWHGSLGRGRIVMIYRDTSVSGDLQLRHLGHPPKRIWDADGVLLVARIRSGTPTPPTDASSSRWGDEDLPF